MAATRKLLGEIQQTLKKVEEGVLLFDDIVEKVYAAGPQTLKEKYEGDLKKEIKKLQRLRDQIKTWLGSNEVKDKSSLMEARKTIESKMEQFKVCEKDTKTKAFSKEGLARQAILDPMDAMKEEKRNWINECLDELNDVINSVEAEKEKLTGAKGNKAKNKELLGFLENRIQKNKWHINKLEHILKLMENDNLDPNSLDSIKESLDYYIESAGEDDGAVGVEDEYDIYEELDLDMDDTATFEIVKGKGNEDQPKEEKAEPPKEETPAPAAKVAASTSNVSSLLGGKAGVKPVTTVSPPVSSKPPVTPVPKGTKSPASVISTSTHSSQGASNSSSESSSSGRERADSATPAISWAHAASTPSPQANSNTPVKSVAAKAAASPAPATTAPLPAAQSAPPPARQPAPAPPAAAVLTTPTPTPPQMSSPLVKPSPSPSPKTGGVHGPAPTLTAPSDTASVSSQNGRTPTTTSSASSIGGHVSEPVPDVTPPSPGSRSQASSASGMSQHRIPAAGAMLNPDLNAAASMLKYSMVNTPEGIELDKHSTYMPKNYYGQTHSTFPSAPLYPTPTSADSPEAASQALLFEKLPMDTLFFAFYFQQGTYQQHLAAKQLKKHSWRFHKKYMTWFQRHEEPKIATDEYEEGTYVYLDYESGWCQRIKSEFKFEYAYLEDEINIINGSNEN